MVRVAFDCLPLIGQLWFLTADTLIAVSVVFAEFFQVTELLAFPRATTQSRKDLDRESKLVLPRGCAFSIGSEHHCGVPGPSQSVQFI